MVVQRYLGAGWASVHGPDDERKLATWTLDLGFAGLVVGPSPRPIDWNTLRSQIEDLPFRIPAARLVAGVDSAGSDAGLASSHAGDRASAIAAAKAAVRHAVGLGISTLVISPGLVPVSGEVVADDLCDPAGRWSQDAAAALFARRAVGRDAALDRSCRALYSLCKEFPDVTFALAPSRRVTGLGEPVGLAAVLEDLGNRRIAYWHDPAIAVCRKQWLGEDQGLWLEQFTDRMVGTGLTDGSATAVNLLPGAGLVDYGMLASYTRRSASMPGVVELDPGVDPGEIAGARSYLSKFGL